MGRLIVAALLVIAAALVDGGVNGGHEAGVRHELPAPYVQQCYAIIEWGGGFCRFRLSLFQQSSPAILAHFGGLFYIWRMI